MFPEIPQSPALLDSNLVGALPFEPHSEGKSVRYRRETRVEELLLRDHCFDCSIDLAIVFFFEPKFLSLCDFLRLWLPKFVSQNTPKFSPPFGRLFVKKHVLSSKKSLKSPQNFRRPSGGIDHGSIRTFKVSLKT